MTDANTFISEFLSSLRTERGASANTLSAYSQDLLQLKEFCVVQRKMLEALTTDDVRKFLAFLRREEVAPRSIARKLSAIKQFYKFLLREEKIELDPCDLLSVSHKEKKLPPTLTVDEMSKLVEAASGNDEMEVRDRALLEVWYATGARVTEVATLSIADVDWKGGLVKIHGKGERQRWVPLTPSALEWCLRYKDVRHEWIRKFDLKDTDTFFLSRLGRRMTRQSLWRLLKKYGEKALLGKKVWPHLIRHSFATHVLQGGADLRAVQELLGHQSIATTEIYTHLDVENLKVMQLKYHPRS